MRNTRVVLAVVVAVGAVLVSLVSMQSARPPDENDLSPKRSAVDIAIKTPTGVRKLSEFKGKVILVDFWATWCGPCRQSIPGVEALYRKFKSSGFEVFGVALEDDDGGQVSAFVKDMGMSYLVGVPIDQKAVYDMMEGREGIPRTILVGRDFMVRNSKNGYSERIEADTWRNVEKLLAEK